MKLVITKTEASKSTATARNTPSCQRRQTITASEPTSATSPTLTKVSDSIDPQWDNEFNVGVR